MSGEALIWFMIGPFFAAGLLVAIRLPALVRTAVLLATLLGETAAASVLLTQLHAGGVLSSRLGLWDSVIAIPFAADAFSALMLLLTSFMTLVTSLFAARAGAAAEPFFCPLVLVMTGGVAGALLTADLFNLFVCIEIMLLPSYALILLAHRGQGMRMQVTASRIYVTVNLLTSSMFLLGVGMLYGVIGTVNLAALFGRPLANPQAMLAVGLIFSALCVKAAVVPVHGWLTRTYPFMSPTVSALFASLHTKIAIYAIFRLNAVLFPEVRPYATLATVIFCVSMAVGVLGALGEQRSRGILSFHMVSQIGYVLLGVALFTPAGIAAGVFYLVHNVVAKASLFLSTGAVEIAYGRHRVGEITGLFGRERWAGVVFFAGAISLAGLPPFSGFVAKYAIVSAAFGAGQWVVGAVAVVVSLFTLMSMLKIWGGSFLGEPNEAADDSPRIGWSLLAPAAVLAAVSLALGLFGQALLGVADVIGQDLSNPAVYVRAVLGR